MLSAVFDTILGLPVHPLVVHATVVFTPMATLLVALCAAIPASRRWLAWPAVAACALACLTVAAAAASGGPLERRVGATAVIRRHSEFAHLLVVWVLAMSVSALVLAYASWYRDGAPLPRRLRLPARAVRWLAPPELRASAASPWVTGTATVLCLVTAVGTLVVTILVGHSGAEAAWAHVGVAGR